MTQESQAPSVRPEEGWHVLHLYYQIDHAQWSTLSRDEQLEAKTNLTELIQEIRSFPETQLLTFAVTTPKADIGFMLLTPDLIAATHFEKRLTLSLGADVLAPPTLIFRRLSARNTPLHASNMRPKPSSPRKA